MTRRNYADIVSGAIIAVFGIVVAIYAFQHYNIGTLQRMGPGMFPMALGILIAALGAVLAIAAWARTGQPSITLADVQWREALFILAAVTLFSLLIRTAGLIPAIVAVVGVSAFADKRANVLTVAVLSAVLCTLAFLIFRVGLRMNFRLLEWPF